MYSNRQIAISFADDVNRSIKSGLTAVPAMVLCVDARSWRDGTGRMATIPFHWLFMYGEFAADPDGSALLSLLFVSRSK